MAKKVDSFPISAKWVYIYSLSGVNLKATNGQIFSLPSGFFALSRDEIQKFFTNNYITVEYDDEDVGFTLFCYDFAVVGIQPASDITMAGLVQVSSDTNLQVKKIVGSADEIKALIDSISGALAGIDTKVDVIGDNSTASNSFLSDLRDSLSGLAVVVGGMSSAQVDGNSSLSGIDTKVDAIGGNTTAANALLSDLKTELIKVYTVCETIANADPDTVLVEMDENIGKIQDNTVAGNSLLTDLKTSLASLASVLDEINSMLSNVNSHASSLDIAVDAIGGNTTAANSLLQNIKDEITKLFEYLDDTSVSSINTFVDAIGGNTTAANSLLSDLKDELTKVYTVCQSILEKGVDSTVTDIDTKVDAIGASVVALNTTASGSKDELTKIYTACQTITTNQGSISSALAGVDTKIDTIGSSIVALNTTVSNVHTELLNVGVTQDNILSSLNTLKSNMYPSVSPLNFYHISDFFYGTQYDGYSYEHVIVISDITGSSVVPDEISCRFLGYSLPYPVRVTVDSHTSSALFFKPVRFRFFYRSVSGSLIPLTESGTSNDAIFDFFYIKGGKKYCFEVNLFSDVVTPGVLDFGNVSDTSGTFWADNSKEVGFIPYDSSCYCNFFESEGFTYSCIRLVRFEFVSLVPVT